MQGLLRVCHKFPVFARKIAQKFNQERYYIDNNTGERIDIESTTVPEDDFAIAFLGDSSAFETCTMGTGPNGVYAHTMRKDNAYVNQRAIYSGYKKMHGLTVLSIMTPDGINYIYVKNPVTKSNRLPNTTLLPHPRRAIYQSIIMEWKSRVVGGYLLVIYRLSFDFCGFKRFPDYFEFS